MVRNLNQLEQRIGEITDQYPFAVHWQVRDIPTGERIGHAEHEVLGAFSTRKVSVLLACLALVHAQRLSLDDMYTIDEELKDGVQAGVMRNLSPGIELSLRDHLAQMMMTSDNICTQLVFKAIDDATGNALQWINDYCAELGMHDTMHREVFPRSAELAWSHSINSMTVTSANDQALILERLGHGLVDEQRADELGLSSQLCEFAIDLMSHLYTPLLGAFVTKGRLVEKNGRGIRGLSQVGMLLDHDDNPIASIAVFAESIPVELRDGTPGRVRAMECFVAIGQVLEEFFLDGTPKPVMRRQVIEPDYWEQELGELIYAVDGGRSVNADVKFPFAGIGKLFFAATVAALETEKPGLLQAMVEITPEHRQKAALGSLRHLTGALQLSINDAVRLMITTSDGAVTLALLDYFEAHGIDIVESGRGCVAHLSNTTISGVEEVSAGDGFYGTTTATDVLIFLRQIIAEKGHVLDWMTGVFEPAGLASTLPGYGPHTIDHWTVYGWERVYDCCLDEGRSSVLILKCPRGFTGMVAHAPVGTYDVPAKFGSLGLSMLARG